MCCCVQVDAACSTFYRQWMEPVLNKTTVLFYEHTFYYKMSLYMTKYMIVDIIVVLFFSFFDSVISCLDGRKCFSDPVGFILKVSSLCEGMYPVSATLSLSV